jgi:hypothetical protein
MPSNNHTSRGDQLAKPNYAFAKRQRDLAKKQKKEEKKKRKLEGANPPPDQNSPDVPAPEKPSTNG